MTSTPTGGWRDQAQVEWYLKTTQRVRARTAGEQLLLDLLPVQPHRLLDLGCGDGRLADLAMSARPSLIEVIAVDRSAPMLAAARRRIGPRPGVRIIDGDLTEPVAHLGSFDAIISGLAIHHLTHARKLELYGEIAEMLTPGGVLLNLDIVTSATAALHAQFLAAVGRDADDPEDRLAPLEDQLDWLRAAGLQDVDGLWRWRGFALLHARRPA